MSKFKYHRTEVLKSLYDLTASVSKKRFINSRPENNSEQLSDFILIRMPNGIQNKGDLYQTAWVQLVVFVRDKTKGVENTLELQNKIDELTDLFPIINSRFTADEPNLIGTGTDNIGFHYAIIQTRIFITK